MKLFGIKFFEKNRVELGEGHVDAYCIIEIKKLFSIIIYNWKTIKQNRFHSHAFPAVAFLLRGKYEQEVMSPNGKIRNDVVNNILYPRFLSKNYTHKIGKADPNTWTIIFVGPWYSYWWEYFENTKTWQLYTNSRKVIGQIWQ